MDLDKLDYCYFRSTIFAVIRTIGLLLERLVPNMDRPYIIAKYPGSVVFNLPPNLRIYLHAHILIFR